jgi:hypothetical protein
LQECILITVRESIPTETIIRAYMDESVEQEQEVTIEPLASPNEPLDAETIHDLDEAIPVKEIPAESAPAESVPSIKNMDSEIVTTRLTFNDYDKVMDEANKVSEVNAPKTIERLEEISSANAMKRMLEEEDDEETGTIRIHGDENVDLGDFDVFELDGAAASKPKPSIQTNDDVLLDFEQL